MNANRNRCYHGLNSSAFEKLSAMAHQEQRVCGTFGARTIFKYQRSAISGKTKSARQRALQRERRAQNELSEAAKGSRPLTSGFLLTTVGTPVQAPSELSLVRGLSPDPPTLGLLALNHEEGIKALEKKLASKRVALSGQDLTRHRAVLQFLFYQRKEKKRWEGASSSGNLDSYISRPRKMTRMDMAMQVSCCFSRGKWFAEQLISWERKWLALQEIPLGK